jgi:hypothetical protein
MQDHCQVIRDEFKLLDKRDPKQLSNFFLRYKFFSTNDLAQVLSLSSRYIRMLKTRTGDDIVRTRQNNRPRAGVRFLPIVELEPGWDCAEWWRHYYKLYGARILAKITHLSIKTVKKRIRKYNIPRTRQAPPLTHPCCNYEWLYKHYVEMDLHLLGCAKAAGVSPDTISSWLNTFKIQVKTRNAPKIRQTENSSAVGEVTCVTVGAD